MAKFLCLSLAALAITTASSRPYNVQQVSDNDLIDAKGLFASVDVLNDIKRSNIEQISDDDLVDTKGLLASVDVLNVLKRELHPRLLDYAKGVSEVVNSRPSQRDIIQTSDDDLVDAKNAHVNIDVLNFGKRGGKKHCFKGKDGQIIQYSDNDLLDLKNLGINIAALNSVHPRDITQTADDDAIDAKNAHVNIDLLNTFNKRATVDAAMDVLRRADYDVDLLSMSKRAVNEMYQYTDNTHTCFCAAKKACESPSTPTAFPSAKPKSTNAHKKHHDHHKTHSHVLVPSPSHPAAHHHKHHDHSVTSTFAPIRTPSKEPTSSSGAIVRPTATAPSCAAGWKHASAGQVIQETDNDLVDLKHLNLDIDILNFGGGKTSKSVPAAEKPTCTGDYCCYKTEKVAKVVQKSDNDVVDLQNLGLNGNLLNGGKLLGGLL